MTSPDGINWTSRNVPDAKLWWSITYGNGLFVAVNGDVSATGAVMTSPDGITWTSRNVPDAKFWRSITYGNGLFVVVNSGVSATSAVMTSPDGINWTSRNVPDAKFWRSITYGNGLFVAVNADVSVTGAVMTSPDGITWTSRDVPDSKAWYGVTYGNGLFVAVNANSSTTAAIMTSNSGTYYNNTSYYQGVANVEVTNDAGSVVYGSIVPTSDTFSIPLTTNTLTASTSTTQYRIRITPKSHFSMPVVPGDSYPILAKVVSLSASVGMIEGSDAASSTITIDNKSTNDINLSVSTWTTQLMDSITLTSGWQSATYANGLFVAVAISGVSGNRVMTSPDGITWTIRTSAADNSWWSVTYGNGMFVAITSDSTSTPVMSSPDGINWTLRIGLPSSILTYGGGLFLSISGSNVATSSNGVTWSTSTGIYSNSWNALAYGAGSFVVLSYETDYGMVYSRVRVVDLVPFNNKITLTFTTPPDTDISSALVLSNTSPVADIPAEGISYSTSTRIGGSDVQCSFTVLPSTTYTCNATYNIFNGIPYYFKLFTRDSRGNYSAGLIASSSSVTPGVVTTLGTGVDPASDTLVPGASATTSNTFTFQTDSFTDTIQSVTVTFATSTATATALVEITNNAGTIVYGSSTNPTSDSTSISLSGLVANTTLTQYRIRVTPKSHTNMPVPQGATYLLTTYISSFVSSSQAIIQQGIDTGSTTLTIDNGSPSNLGTAGINWTVRNGTTTNAWSSIAYGNGLFVAVASFSALSGTRVMTSPDGINWTNRTSAADSEWGSVTYWNGLFVAVASSGAGSRVMTSPDGITWTGRSAAATRNWQAVTYGNGLFVAIANSGTGDRVMTSPDGINWTSRTSAADNSWNSVTFGNDLFVAVSTASLGTIANRVMTSPDGITWTARTAAANNDWRSVTYGNGLFVASASSGAGDRVMTSPDGITWTSRTSVADNSWNSVTYGDGLFVAVSAFAVSSRVMTSPDGINWTPRSTTGNWNRVTYGNGLFVAVSGDGILQSVMTSDNLPTSTSTSTQNSINFSTPTDTDVSSIVILRSTSVVIDSPVEGTSYATSSTIGASTVACSFSVSASSTFTCNDSGLVNGTPYYYKLFTRDITGNYSVGADLPSNPVSPGSVTVTLGTGSDPASISIAPGATATTSDTFTFQTDSSTDVIQSVTVTFASSTATSTSLVEITNDAGNTVYGSVSNPTTDTPTITLTGLTANTTPTQYRIRITPKSHVNMPAVPGATYFLTSYISSWVGTAARYAGSDLNGGTTTVLTIDNTSPAAPSSVTGAINVFDAITIRYTNPSTSDATSTTVLRSTSLITDSPVEGVTYTAGNSIGASTVTCVANNITLGGTASCVYTPPKGTNYYFRIFTRDNNGNYSSGVVPTGQPFYVASLGSGGTGAEPETQNGIIGNVGGGGGGGSGGNTGTTTNATTTATTTNPCQGGCGGGDVGLKYNGSTLAKNTTLIDSLFASAVDIKSSVDTTLTYFFLYILTNGADGTYAKENKEEPVCNIMFLGFCVLKDIPFVKSR